MVYWINCIRIRPAVAQDRSIMKIPTSASQPKHNTNTLGNSKPSTTIRIHQWEYRRWSISYDSSCWICLCPNTLSLSLSLVQSTRSLWFNDNLNMTALQHELDYANHEQRAAMKKFMMQELSDKEGRPIRMERQKHAVSCWTSSDYSWKCWRFAWYAVYVIPLLV